MLNRLFCATLAAMLVPMLLVSRTAPAAAATPGIPDFAAAPFATPMSDVLGGTVSSDAFAPSAPALASGFAVAPPDADRDDRSYYKGAYGTGTRYEATRYRPRRGRSHGRNHWRGRGVSQVHAGFLDPDGPSEAGFLAGFRGGQKLDDMVEIGLGLDWRNKSGRATELLQETVGPGGETIIVRRDLSRYSSNLFPLLAYVQVSGPSHLTLVPYAGAAASWQVLFLQADDFTTGEAFDATYDGFGWQLWGGAALPLSGRSRLFGEVFMNRADLNRDAYDFATGQDFRETVKADGVGARFGLSWGY